jgi:hypothetical protein
MHQIPAVVRLLLREVLWLEVATYACSFIPVLPFIKCLSNIVYLLQPQKLGCPESREYPSSYLSFVLGHIVLKMVIPFGCTTQMQHKEGSMLDS